MKEIKIKDLNELREIFEEFGYFPNEEILTEAYLGLTSFGMNTFVGQDIWAMCLDGPAGAGKTSFTEAYKDVASYYLDEEVEFINYECNDTTGKSELYEEVGMVAVVLKDEKKIIIPGAVVEAINKVNEGKKVVLLLDEFDKSRTETDVFFYKFLQSGEINTTQLGDLSIKPEYKSNLQVFFCKNDFRELSGPLSRRTRNLMLDYMKPSLFYDIAMNKLTGKALDEHHIISLINLVTLIYEFAYQNKEKFDRLPAPSEMLIAIQDAYKLSVGLNINGKIMYSLIFKRLFKSLEDYSVFESLLSKCTDEQYKEIKNFLEELKSSEDSVTEESLKSKIANDILKSVLEDKTKELDEKISNYDTMMDEKSKELEEQKNILIQERMNLRQNISQDNTPSVINLSGGDLVLGNGLDNITTNFDDSTEFVKRGQNIFDINKNANWTYIASMKVKNANHKEFIKKMIDSAPEMGFAIYENGISFNSDGIQLVMVSENINGDYSYKFLTSTQIVPSTYIYFLSVYMKMFLQYLGKNDKKADISFNALIYNDEELELDSVISNVYKLTLDFSDVIKASNELKNFNFKCEDKSKVLEKCIELLDENSKKLIK